MISDELRRQADQFVEFKDLSAEFQMDVPPENHDHEYEEFDC